MAVEDTYTNDDWFDLDKYKQAAGVAYDYSKKKIEDTGEQDRLSIGKGGEETRKTTKQDQDFKRFEEDRDFKQSQAAYRY